MKYQRKTHQLKPFILQFKIQLILVILLLTILCVNAFIENTDREIMVNVNPKKELIKEDSVNYAILQNKIISLKNLTSFENIFAKSIDKISDPIFMVQTLTILLFIGFVTFGISKQKYFHFKLSKWLLLLFFIQFFFLLIDKWRDYFTSNLVKSKTDGLYFSENSFETLISNNFLFTIIILWLFFVFKKGEKLQIESDLTV